MLLGRLPDQAGPLEILRQLPGDPAPLGLGFPPSPARLSSGGWDRLGEELLDGANLTVVVLPGLPPGAWLIF